MIARDIVPQNVNTNDGEYMNYLLSVGDMNAAEDLRKEQYNEGVLAAWEGREVGEHEPLARRQGYQYALSTMHPRCIMFPADMFQYE
jgi:hypothetical protein